MGSPNPEQPIDVIQDQVLGYLNFSSGNHDPKFFANVNLLFARLADQAGASESPDKTKLGRARKVNSLAESNEHVLARQVGKGLLSRLAEVSKENPTFRDATQCQSVLDITFGKLLPAYRKHHRDLLFHQSDEFLFNSFFVSRALETTLSVVLRDPDSRSWDQVDEIVADSLRRLNDYLGHRPVATLESQKIEPYLHEWIRPVPIYIADGGVAVGRYHDITQRAIQILRETDPHILRAAHFDTSKLDELAIDPRAFDFDHPINQRPNHHFGEWDSQHIDGSGYFRRFIVHQVTIDALNSRVEKCSSDSGDSIDFDEAMCEAAAVMAGTMLMGSGISGSGPGTYDSNTTLGKLLPGIANYRDQFYADLLYRLPPEHRERLEQEAATKHQPFGAVRQDLNAQLAQRRASQLVNCRLASIFARMGYPAEAQEQSKIVPVAAARINCQIDCLLSAASVATKRGELDEAFAAVPKIMGRLKRGIHCGAIVDPWNIIGFDANYSLFPAVENSVRDHRVFDLVDVMERIFAHCSRLWSEAAASDREDMCVAIRKEFLSIVDWWRQYAAHEVMAVDAVDADDIFQAAELVAEALSLWHKGGAAAGDIEFWAQHADLFDSPKAYALVVDALMQRRDYKTSMAILVHWMSQAEFILLHYGDSSFHTSVFRWITDQKKLLDNRGEVTPDEKDNPEPTEETEDQATPEIVWNRIRKFHDFLEANAEQYWEVPTFDLSQSAKRSERPDPFDDEDDEPDSEYGDDESEEDIYGAAYDNVIFTDTADDGHDGEIFDGSLSSDDALEAEVDRVMDRLEFLTTIAEYWEVAAKIPLPVLNEDETVTDVVRERLNNRKNIIEAWVGQAARNRGKLLELLNKINRHPLSATGSDHEAMLFYDQQRVLKDSLLEQAIATCIETENSIRMLVAVVQAVDHILGEGNPSSTDMPSDSLSSEVTKHVNGGAPVVSVYAGILLQKPKLVVENFPALTEYLHDQSLLYVPLSKGGDPAAIVQARVVQTAILDLLKRMPAIGLFVETHELTRTALAMERNNPIGRGAVTEFDEIFEVAYISMVHVLVQATGQLKEQRVAEGLSKSEIKEEGQSVLFDCIEMLTESMLMLWLEHSKTLRLSVLEKVHDKQSWEKMVEFIQNYGSGLFTQQFLHLSNIRAILHQGVDRWLPQMQQSTTRPDHRLFDELGQVLPEQKAVRYLTLILESVIENYNEYRDYNTTTTQSDSGDSLFMFLDFLRLRSRYDRVCWNLKPVVWAHRILVNDQENGVARMWRRSLTERVGPEAEKYLDKLEKLRGKYSIRMSSVARRLEGRFGHQMQIDRLKALVGPAMADPDSRKSARVFELLHHEAQAFSRSTMGVGVDLPAWLAALENEVQKHLDPHRIHDASMNYALEENVTIAKLREQLEALPRREE
ncbi:MAG: hypothetical protein AB8B55_23380 [Mariniblastus sp.]